MKVETYQTFNKKRGAFRRKRSRIDVMTNAGFQLGVVEDFNEAEWRPRELAIAIGKTIEGAGHVVYYHSVGRVSDHIVEVWFKLGHEESND